MLEVAVIIIALAALPLAIVVMGHLAAIIVRSLVFIAPAIFVIFLVLVAIHHATTF